MNVIACDPGEHTGLVLYYLGSDKNYHARRPAMFRIVSKKGALGMHDWFSQVCSKYDPMKLVIEHQFARPGRSMSGLIGLARNAGAAHHEARCRGIEIIMVKPSDWKAPVIDGLGGRWRDPPEEKDALIYNRACEILGVPPFSQDVADATLIGHWYLNPGIYL